MPDTWTFLRLGVFLFFFLFFPIVHTLNNHEKLMNGKLLYIPQYYSTFQLSLQTIFCPCKMDYYGCTMFRITQIYHYKDFMIICSVQVN